MSVAGLKKQFYKASQVSGGRGGARWGWCAAPGSDSFRQFPTFYNINKCWVNIHNHAFVTFSNY